MESPLSDPLIRVCIQPGGDDGCKVVRYESATSDLVDVEEILTDHAQVLRDIGKLEAHEAALEQKRLGGGGGGSAPAADGSAGAGAMAQMLLTRESGKTKMVKELLMAATGGARASSFIVFLPLPSCCFCNISRRHSLHGRHARRYSQPD